MSVAAVNTYRAGRGLVPVTQVDCPSYADVDIRFSKIFPFGLGHRVEFIAQLFNVTNRANFAVPSGSILAGTDASGRPLFGQPNSLAPNINAPSRQVEIAFRFQF
jgi:hypothetical protein